MGFGAHASGGDAALYYKRKNNDVSLYETRPISSFSKIAENLESEGVHVFFREATISEIKKADILVKSALVPLNYQIRHNAKDITNDIASLLGNERVEKIKKILFLGSRDQSISASVLSQALTSLGKKVILAGNNAGNGYYTLSCIEKDEKDPDFVIINLSGQLLDETDYALCSSWPSFDLVIIAGVKIKNTDVLKNIASSSLQIFTERHIYSYFSSALSAFKKKIRFIPHFKNIYKDNSESLPVYEAMRQLGYKKEEIKKGVSSYRGIENQNEQVAFFDNILYINDSSSNIPVAVNITFKKLSAQYVHIITGGSEVNMLDPSLMLACLKKCTSITLLSGSFSSKLKDLLDSMKIEYNGPFSNMTDAVRAAYSEARRSLDINYQNTQIILLSPGASSYEMFKNEYERGEEFKKAVKNIILEK